MLAFILSKIMDESLRRAMLMFYSDPTVFFRRPISLGIMMAAALMLLLVIIPAIRHKKEEALKE